MLRIRLNKRHLLSGIAIAGTLWGGIFVHRGVYLWLTSSGDNLKQTHIENVYIYLPENQQNSVERFVNESTSLSNSFPNWLRNQQMTHWKLLKLAKSRNERVRRKAVASLAGLKNLDDGTCREIAQACDFATCLELAKQPGIDQRLFLPPPTPPTNFTKDEVSISICNLLNSLPKQHAVDECLQFFTKVALENIATDVEETVERLTSEGDLVRHHKRLPQSASIRICLEALLRQSEIPEHRKSIVKMGGLQILQRVPDIYWPNQELVAKIVSNLGLEVENSRPIFKSGWLGILAQWLNSDRLELELIATRVISNMEALRKGGTESVYQSGVFLLHPKQDIRDGEMKMDIIFVHGLLGGVFRTWRQHDTGRLLDNATDIDSENLAAFLQGRYGRTYSRCWPKDWLANDCRNVRILAMDYDTSLSHWIAKCPYGNQNNTLEARSSSFLSKLSLAGVGKRPIIWVTHSMGGLLVKEMLLQAQVSEDPKLRDIVANTAGTVFYSVPHFGSDVANLKRTVQFVTMPSVEVNELKDVSRLRHLNNRFRDLIESNQIKCLSFGENLKTNVGLKLNLNVLLVKQESSNPGYGDYHILSVNHLNICKPKAPSCELYAHLLKFIQDQLQSLVEPEPDIYAAFQLLALPQL